MTQQAILHTATRIIRRLTTDVTPPIGSDETLVPLVAPIDLAGGPWVLGSDNLTMTHATAAQIAVESTPMTPPNIQLVIDACVAIASDGTLSPKLRVLATALKGLLS